jgi:hypothetical protein
MDERFYNFSTPMNRLQRPWRSWVLDLDHSQCISTKTNRGRTYSSKISESQYLNWETVNSEFLFI